jgi:hypothetical protein
MLVKLVLAFALALVSAQPKPGLQHGADRIVPNARGEIRVRFGIIAAAAVIYATHVFTCCCQSADLLQVKADEAQDT